MLQKNKEQLKKYSKLSLIGFIAGMISGFFSTGGGLILVPAFLYLLEIDSQKARGTSVFCILPMVLTSSIFYYKGKTTLQQYILQSCMITFLSLKIPF